MHAIVERIIREESGHESQRISIIRSPSLRRLMICGSNGWSQAKKTRLVQLPMRSQTKAPGLTVNRSCIAWLRNLGMLGTNRQAK